MRKCHIGKAGWLLVSVLVLAGWLACPIPTRVVAQGEGDDATIPFPRVWTGYEAKTTIDPISYDCYEIYRLRIFHGDTFECSMMARKCHDSQNGLFVDYVSMFNSNVQGSVLNFQTDLGSRTGSSPSGYPAIFANVSGVAIPIHLYNASSFDMVTGSVSDEAGYPTFTNVITFRNIAMETYGHGLSEITLTMTQHYVANWTNLRVKTDVLVDLTNMQLYYPGNQSAVSPGTDYSLNLVYTVGLINYTAMKLGRDGFIAPANITATSIHYEINGTDAMDFSVADLTMTDNYTEVQGLNQIPDRHSTCYFDPQGTSGCNAVQIFSNLTYGVTTSIASDPVIDVTHDRVPAGWGSNSGGGGDEWIVPSIVAGSIAAAVTCVAFVVKRRKSRGVSAAVQE
jgi:hypothetical protein